MLHNDLCTLFESFLQVQNGFRLNFEVVVLLNLSPLSYFPVNLIKEPILTPPTTPAAKVKTLFSFFFGRKLNKNKGIFNLVKLK